MVKQPVTVPYELFVDGSPGPKKGEGWAGWGIALMAGISPVYEACGVAADRLSTDAIELEALIQGLSYLLRLDMPAVIPVWSDNRYVVTIMADLPRLGRDEFLDRAGNPIKNYERIRMLYDLWFTMGMHDRCLIRTVQGHTGVAGNERADLLSKRAAYKGEIWYRDNPTIFHTEIKNNDTDTDKKD